MSPGLLGGQAVGTVGWHMTILFPRPEVPPWADARQDKARKVKRTVGNFPFLQK